MHNKEAFAGKRTGVVCATHDWPAIDAAMRERGWLTADERSTAERLNGGSVNRDSVWGANQTKQGGKGYERR